MPDLQFNIVGNDKEFREAIKSVQDQLKQLQSEVKGFKPIPAAIVPPATTPALEKLKRTTDVAGQSLTNLSRIAQDAPFGFIGIANNLNPLIEGFGRLRQEAKANEVSLGTALRGALLGPMGIGLAIGIVSGLLSAFGDKLFKTVSPADELKKKLDAARQSADLFKATMGDVAAVRMETAQSANEELTTLALLYRASQDATLSTKQRKEAVDELQRLYPAYFANIKDEAFLTGGAAKAYDTLRDSIIAASRARAAQKRLDQVQDDKELTEEQRKPVTKELIAARRVEADAKAALRKLLEEGGFKDFQLANATNAVNEATEKRMALSEKNLTIQNAYLDLLQREEKLVNTIYGTIRTNGPKVLTTTPGDLEGPKAPKTPTAYVAPYVQRAAIEMQRLINEVPPVDLTPLLRPSTPANGTAFGNYFEFLREEATAEMTKLFRTIGRDLPAIELPANASAEQIRAAYTPVFNQMKREIETITGMVNGLLTPAFQGLFDAILAGEPALQGFFKGLVGAVNQLIQKIIQAAVQAAVLSALSAFFPGLGGGGGFGAIFGRALGMANGGMVPAGYPNDTFPARLSSGEAVIPINRLSRVLGGSAAGGFSGRVEIQGRSLVLVAARENRSQYRNF